MSTPDVKKTENGRDEYTCPTNNRSTATIFLRCSNPTQAVRMNTLGVYQPSNAALITDRIICINCIRTFTILEQSHVIIIDTNHKETGSSILPPTVKLISIEDQLYLQIRDKTSTNTFCHFRNLEKEQFRLDSRQQTTRAYMFRPLPKSIIERRYKLNHQSLKYHY